MTNTHTTCPHYPAAGAVPGQPSRCRGCGAIIAQPNLVSPELIATYPTAAAQVDRATLTFPSTSGLVFPIAFPQGAPPSVQAQLAAGNPTGQVLSEV